MVYLRMSQEKRAQIVSSKIDMPNIAHEYNLRWLN